MVTIYEANKLVLICARDVNKAYLSRQGNAQGITCETKTKAFLFSAKARKIQGRARLEEHKARRAQVNSTEQ